MPDSPNPRYTVKLSDTNHPVPIDVYAWAAEDPYHQVAAQQHRIGDVVIMQDVGGVLSIMRNAAEGTPEFAPDTLLRYGTDTSIRMNETGIILSGGAGVAAFSANGLLIAAPSMAQNVSNVLVHGNNGFALQTDGVTMESHTGGGLGGTMAFGRRPGLDSSLHRAVVSKVESGAALPDLTMIPVDFELEVGPTNMPQSVRGSITLNLSQIIAWADALSVSSDGLMGSAAPPAPPSIGAIRLLYISDTEWAIEFNPLARNPTSYTVVLYYGFVVLSQTEVENFTSATGMGAVIQPTLARQATVASNAIVSGNNRYLLEPIDSTVEGAIRKAVTASTAPGATPATRASVASDLNTMRLLTNSGNSERMLRVGQLNLTHIRGDRYRTTMNDLLLGFTAPNMLPVHEVILGTFHMMAVDNVTGAPLTSWSPPYFAEAVIIYDRPIHDPGTSTAIWSL